jgi:hypothetical protein
MSQLCKLGGKVNLREIAVSENSYRDGVQQVLNPYEDKSFRSERGL